MIKTREEIKNMSDEEYDVYMKERVSENKKAVLDIYLNTDTDTIINDHHPEKEDKIYGIVEFRGEDKDFAPLYLCRYYCFNRLYADSKNKIHLSTWSIAGTIFPTGISDECVIEDCLKYNKSCTYDRSKISKVYMKDHYITIGEDEDSCTVEKYN